MKLKCILIIIVGVVIAGCRSPKISDPKLVADFSPQPVLLESVASREEWEKRQYNTSESAVMRCLRWLKKEQNKDGSWSTRKDPKALATSMALLCFLAHGETPASETFGTTVENAIKYLLSVQDKEGRFKKATKYPAIEHGIITWALCETYSLTRVPMIKDASEKAINIILESQLPSGLWNSNYLTTDGFDMEVSVWQILALKAARLSGLEDERLRPALKKPIGTLNEFIVNNNQSTTSAPALRCLLLIGRGNDPIIKKGIITFDGVTVNWKKPVFDNPVYQWHFISDMKFYYGEETWIEWNKSFLSMLTQAQKIQKNAVKDKNGRKRDVGYWVSPGKNERYGKIYSTTLCCMMLKISSIRPTFKLIDIEDIQEGDDHDEVDIEIEI